MIQRRLKRRGQAGLKIIIAIYEIKFNIPSTPGCLDS